MVTTRAVALGVFAIVALGGSNSAGGADQANDKAVAESPKLILDAQTGELTGVRVGMTAAQVRALGYPTLASSVMEEGERYPTMRVTIADGVELVALFAGELLHRYTVTSPRVTTRLGSGVGTTWGELKQRYPDGRLLLGYEAGKHANFVSGSKVIIRLDMGQIDEVCFVDDLPRRAGKASAECVADSVKVNSLVVDLHAN